MRPKRVAPSRKLEVLFDALTRLVRVHRPILAVMEGPSYNSTNKPFSLGEAYGICKLVLQQNGVPLVIVAPKALKKFATGRGTAAKEAMVKSAGESGCPSDQHDICDAWMAARLAQDILSGQACSGTRAAEEVVALLRQEIPTRVRKPIRAPEPTI